MQTVEFRLPSHGDDEHEAEVVKWLVEEGEYVREMEPIVEVQTDKAVIELPAPITGRIRDIVAAAGSIARTGDVLAVLEPATPVLWMDGRPVYPSPAHSVDLADGAGEAAEEKDDPLSSPEHPLDAERPPEAEDRQVQAEADEEEPRPSEARGPEPVPIAPWVEPPTDSLLWRMVRNAERAAQRNQRKRWEGSPDDDAVLRPYYPAAKPQTAEQTERASTRVPFRGVRRATAEHVTRSAFTAPHVTVFDECEATELVALRQRWNRVLEPEGQRLSYLPFLVKATVSALKAVPYMNARLDEQAQEIELIANYHIGIAVETPEGLYVPVIRHADRLTVREIGEEIFRLRQAARERTLGQQDLHGSTFTITNMGPIGGGLFATPIIHYPEVGILGIHQIQRKPVARGDEVVIRDMIGFSLSFDHRVIDGVTAVRFLNHIKNLVEHPELLMLEMK
ncbi:dihydrolipoamide acetyltransferase family protein [Alicyclobacillus macrosporangiidus]|uniref:dihydrolipoamide acetyltransferase family protein n=1 Tax=Alicyclobacillus macrosporangiidus TaxID=392015 RepID=UPI000496E210|nr:dihydrolipoamide acetyltransferase family protein [Alicyclobacillus macrosporangiidus]